MTRRRTEDEADVPPEATRWRVRADRKLRTGISLVQVSTGDVITDRVYADELKSSGVDLEEIA